MSHDTDTPNTLPDALLERLRARDRRVSMLTPQVDRALDAAARAQFAGRRRPAVFAGWRYAAAAAVVFVALFLLRPFDSGEADRLRLAGDIDGSGQVDVLDVFALARSRAADPASVSQARIDELAARIVSLARVDAADPTARDGAVL